MSLKLHNAQTSDSCDRDTIHPVTRHCTISMIVKVLRQQSVAVML